MKKTLIILLALLCVAPVFAAKKTGIEAGLELGFANSTSYVHGQFTESVDSPFEGRANVHWLTGTASTVMVGCVEGICGMRPDADGLTIAPSIPAEWDGFKIEKNFRGKKLNINIDNSAHVQSGVKEITLNGTKLEKNYVPADMLADVNEIKVVLG